MGLTRRTRYLSGGSSSPRSRTGHGNSLSRTARWGDFSQRTVRPLPPDHHQPREYCSLHCTPVLYSSLLYSCTVLLCTVQDIYTQHITCWLLMLILKSNAGFLTRANQDFLCKDWDHNIFHLLSNSISSWCDYSCLAALQHMFEYHFTNHKHEPLWHETILKLIQHNHELVYSKVIKFINNVTSDPTQTYVRWCLTEQ